MKTRRTMLYRDKRNGKIFGVCSGIADYIGVDPLFVRIGLVVATLCGMGWPFMAYIAAAFLLNDKPMGTYVDENETRYWQSVRQNPQRAAREVRAKMRDIDRRLSSVENYYVNGNPSLSAEIEKLR